MNRLFTAGLALLLATAGAGRAADKPKADLPVKAKLTGDKTTFTLDLGGMTGEEFRKALKEAEKKGGKFPEPPKVDLVLELTNTSAKDVEIYIGGDQVMLQLELKGPGAVSVKPLLAFTTDFRGPRPTTLGPGKSFLVQISGLKYGFRGVAESAYWTEPGDYTLTASFVTALTPSPDGVKPDEKGFGKVTLTTEPIKLKVEAKK
jgi:hypothetical protein